MELVCVCIAALFQVMGYSVFIKQSEDECSPAPPLGSFLFLFATMLFLWDISIYPSRFQHMNKCWQLLVELVACIFLAEVATLIIWCGLERVIYWLTQHLIRVLIWGGCGMDKFKYWMHGFSTSAVGGALLCFIMKATMFRMAFPWKQLWCMLSNIWRMDSRDRRRTLKACQLAMCPPHQQSNNNDDDEEQEESGEECEEEQSDCDEDSASD